VTRTYDKAGRLESVSDWLEHTIKFGYDADSDLMTTTFPTATSGVDKYAYNAAAQMTEVKMSKSTETLASLVYARENVGQVKTVTSKSLPGEEKPGYTYDENNRLTKGGTVAYEYDTSNDPTKIGSSKYTYDKASELEKGPSLKDTYDELGERTKTTPTTGPATTYGYDQSGNLISVTRPEEGATPKIEDVYAYDGTGLRASQTINGTTSYLTWGMSEELPLLLNDGTNNYIYGPNGLPIEQINNTTGAVLYLHHDQQGSTRLLTGSTGKAEATFTYDAYGNQTGHTGTATTPLGYDAQYTSSDTGLIYLRARSYDPTTGQFLSVDPMDAISGEPYSYAGDDPVNRTDPSGLLESAQSPGELSVPCIYPFCSPPPPVVEAFEHGFEKVKEGIINAITESNGDEGEAELRESEAQRTKECGEPNPGNFEKLNNRETKRILDEAGTDAHTDKGETVGGGEAGHYDYYRDKSTGEIYLVPKGGGEPIPTGLGR
jgi:RHS repeat-associated protein